MVSDKQSAFVANLYNHGFLPNTRRIAEASAQWYIKAEENEES